jgi:hypothetical protein
VWVKMIFSSEMLADMAKDDLSLLELNFFIQHMRLIDNIFKYVAEHPEKVKKVTE